MTRKQAVNEVRRRLGATDRRSYHVRSRVVAGERRIEIHRRSQAIFHVPILGDRKKPGMARKFGQYSHHVSNGQVLVFSSRRSWTHAAAQSGVLR